MIAGHLVLGAATYQAVKGKPNWLKWLLLLPAGFVTHWIFDSVVAYHTYTYQSWYDFFIVGINTFAIIIMFAMLLIKRGRHGIPAILTGIWFWICWDWDWIFGGRFLHLSSSQILARHIPGQSLDPWTVVLELIFVLIFMMIAIPGRK